MLERIGGECASAVTSLPAGEPLPPREYGYRKLSEDELAGILRELPRRPLLAGEKGVRLSLAGAQDKIAVRIEDDEICLPTGRAQHAHPQTGCAAVRRRRFQRGFLHAARGGLRTADRRSRAQERRRGGRLLVQRYDRVHRPEQRLHQEDFCQALGIPSERQYQKEGGPSLKQCFALLREVSTAPVLDFAQLLDAVIFHYLAGNNAAHGKNFSLLHSRANETRLAPLYDVVCTIYHPELSRDLPMRIGGELSADRITIRSFEQLAQEAGLGKALVRRRVIETEERVLAAIPSVTVAHPAARAIADLIRKRAEKLRPIA